MELDIYEHLPDEMHEKSNEMIFQFANFVSDMLQNTSSSSSRRNLNDLKGMITKITRILRKKKKLSVDAEIALYDSMAVCMDYLSGKYDIVDANERLNKNANLIKKNRGRFKRTLKELKSIKSSLAGTLALGYASSQWYENWSNFQRIMRSIGSEISNAGIGYSSIVSYADLDPAYKGVLSRVLKKAKNKDGIYDWVNLLNQIIFRKSRNELKLVDTVNEEESGGLIASVTRFIKSNPSITKTQQSIQIAEVLNMKFDHLFETVDSMVDLMRLILAVFVVLFAIIYILFAIRDQVNIRKGRRSNNKRFRILNDRRNYRLLRRFSKKKRKKRKSRRKSKKKKIPWF